MRCVWRSLSVDHLSFSAIISLFSSTASYIVRRSTQTPPLSQRPTEGTLTATLPFKRRLLSKPVDLFYMVWYPTSCMRRTCVHLIQTRSACCFLLFVLSCVNFQFYAHQLTIRWRFLSCLFQQCLSDRPNDGNSWGPV